MVEQELTKQVTGVSIGSAPTQAGFIPNVGFVPDASDNLDPSLSSI